jgi:Cu/Ag efflux protein CusF
MRKLALLVLAFAMTGLLLAQATPALAAGTTHDMKATVVSVDIEHKMLTITDEQGEEMTAPVLEGAEKQLNGLKAGDKITLTCQDNENGEHEGVSKITHSKA